MGRLRRSRFVPRSPLLSLLCSELTVLPPPPLFMLCSVHKAQRDVHRAARTRVRKRDLDLIQKFDLTPEGRAALEAQPIDEEKPGLGQHVSLHEASSE